MDDDCDNANDADSDKYKRRSATVWFKRWWRYVYFLSKNMDSSVVITELKMGISFMPFSLYITNKQLPNKLKYA